MKLTKLEHACLILEKDNRKLVIDPGEFTNLPEDLSNFDAVVITEEHFDHFNPTNLSDILLQSPDATVFSTPAVCAELKDADIECVEVDGKKTIEAGVFELNFYGTDHAPVYKMSPCRSLPVRVDNYVYYSSDTFLAIDEPVEVLALATSGPWYKLEEAIDQAKDIQAKIVIPTHNALNSDAGNKVNNSFLKARLEPEGFKVVEMKPGDTY